MLSTLEPRSSLRAAAICIAAGVGWLRKGGVAAPAAAEGVHGQAIAAGVVYTFLLSLVFSGVLALVVFLSSVSEARVTSLLFYSGIASLVIGAGWGARRASGLGWLHGALTGGVYVILSVIVGLIVFPGGVGAAELTRRLLLGCGVGLIGGMIGVNLG